MEDAVERRAARAYLEGRSAAVKDFLFCLAEIGTAVQPMSSLFCLSKGMVDCPDPEADRVADLL